MTAVTPCALAATLRRRFLPCALICALLISACARRDGTRALDGLQSPAGGRIVEVAEPWIDGCGDRCEDAYRELATRRGLALGRERDWLAQQLDTLQAMPLPTSQGLDADTLGARIVEELRTDFLLEGIGQRVLAVTRIRETTTAAYVERKLLFWDPEVGSFEGVLLLPRGEGPHPAVLALHGHRQNDEIFVADYLGRELAEAGIAVLAPRFRAFDCSLSESQIAARLARVGLTLMGVRVYESLLMLEYLRHLDAVDTSRLGLLGHSGGTSVGHLLVRISDAFRTQVFDVGTTGVPLYWRNACGLLDVHCETLPGLFPLSADINDKSTVKIPHLAVPYHFREEETRTQILSFFEATLADATRRPGSPVGG